MTAKEYIDSKATPSPRGNIIDVYDAYKAVDRAKYEFSEDIIGLINIYRERYVKGDIADYVKSYCEGYCEGIEYFI